jgi:PAS domain S-box-containing protein
MKDSYSTVSSKMQKTLALRKQLAEAEKKLAEAHQEVLRLRSGQQDRVLSNAIDRQRTLLNHEEARRQSELLQLSYDAIIVWKFDGFIEGWNVGAERLYGYTEAEALGKVTHELLETVHPEPWAAIRVELLAMGFWEGELTHRTRDGHEVVVSARKQLILDTDGVVRVLEINRDITAHKRIEARLRRFYETDLFAILYWRIDGGVLDVNDKFLQMTGYTREDLHAGRLNWSHMTPAEYHDLDEDARRQLRETGVHRPFEKEFIRKDGTRVWGLFSAAAWEDNPDEGVSFILDITERKRADEQLRLARNRFEVALRDSPIVVFNQDLSLRYTWIYNPALGYRASEVLGKLDSELFEHPEDAAATEEIKQEVIRTGVSRRQEVRIHSNGTDRYYDLVADPYRDHDGRVVGVTCAAIDITERKQAAQALIQSEKLASVGRMASTIAHEINNPLEAIGNAIYLAATDPGSSSKIREYLEMATHELDRVTHITKQTLAFHRETVKPTPIHLSESIDDLLRLFTPRLKSRGIAVEKHYEPAPRIIATRAEVQQIVANLLSNSMDATPKHGRIIIHISGSPVAGESSGVRLTIADTGTGIPAESRDRIFEPFYTTKEVVGTGLGLWVTRQIIEKHGGRIRLRSKVGQGTVFSVTFPNLAPAPEAS